jgi:hypothetical protein
LDTVIQAVNDAKILKNAYDTWHRYQIKDETNVKAETEPAAKKAKHGNTTFRISLKCTGSMRHKMDAQV